MLGLDILKLHDGMEEECWYALEASSLRWSPSGSQPLGSSEWVRGETQNKTSWGRFHAASLKYCYPIWQTLNSIMMLRPQSCCTLSVSEPWKTQLIPYIASDNEQSEESSSQGLPMITKPAGFSFLLLLFFLMLFSSPCPPDWIRTRVLWLPLCHQMQSEPRTQAEALPRQSPAQPGFHTHLVSGSMEPNSRNTGISGCSGTLKKNPKSYSFIMQPRRAFAVWYLVYWIKVNSFWGGFSHNKEAEKSS